jgi:anti-sigma28 factor (negative regulator of flagellin synthesis)
LNTQKPNTEKVYETNTKVSPRTPKPPSAPGEDGVALGTQDQLRHLAMAASAEETSRVERLTQLVQSGQYQVDHLALGGAIVAAMLKGY